MNSLGKIIDKLSFRLILGSFLTIWLVAALIYWILCDYGHGLSSQTAADGISLIDAMYFSIVTISSLGFGDFQPIGWSRLIAAIEVVLGLVVLGVAISKVSSERSSYLLQRVYSSDVQMRLAVSREKLETSVVLLEDGVDSAADAVKCEAAIGEGYAIVYEIRRFVGYETHFHDFFDLLPPKAIRQVLVEVRNYIIEATGIIESVRELASSRKTVMNSVYEARSLAKKVRSSLDQPQVEAECESLLASCNDCGEKLKVLGLRDA